MTPYTTILTQLAQILQDCFGDQHVETPLDIFEIPPDATFGDIAFPCFAFSKIVKKNPVLIAQDIVAAIQKKPHALIERAHAKGAYVNFFLSAKILAKKIIPLTFADPLYGIKQKGKTKSIVLEYVSPNTNKPLHLGHMRNAFLGDSIAQLIKATGQKVYKTCLVNDRGIHICKSMVAYQDSIKGKGQTLPTPKTKNKKGDHFVGDYYVLFETMLKKDPSLQDSATECLKKWEAQDKQTRMLWKKMNTWVLKGFASTFKEIGISFDKTYYESEIYNQGRDRIIQAVENGIFKKDETGAVFASLEEYGLPNKVLLRQDGTSIYITQDMHLAYKRAKDFKNARTLYVVGSEQDMYFRQLFAILKLMGFGDEKNLVHISYGIVNLPEGRMKSREGTVVDADDLIKELKTMVFKILDTRDEKLHKKERERRAHAIALAALRYYILEVNPVSDMVFNPKESISFHGRTGPYIQYTYARLKSIIRKSTLSERSISKKRGEASYSWNPEKNLLILLTQFSYLTQEAADSYIPSMVARYIYRLAKTANEYYHEHPILTAPKEERGARLSITLATSQVLKEGLALLGISVLEKM